MTLFSLWICQVHNTQRSSLTTGGCDVTHRLPMIVKGDPVSVSNSTGSCWTSRSHNIGALLPPPSGHSENSSCHGNHIASDHDLSYKKTHSLSPVIHRGVHLSPSPETVSSPGTWIHPGLSAHQLLGCLQISASLLHSCMLLHEILQSGRHDQVSDHHLGQTESSPGCAHH